MDKILAIAGDRILENTHKSWNGCTCPASARASCEQDTSVNPETHGGHALKSLRLRFSDAATSQSGRNPEELLTVVTVVDHHESGRVASCHVIGLFS